MASRKSEMSQLTMTLRSRSRAVYTDAQKVENEARKAPERGKPRKKENSSLSAEILPTVVEENDLAAKKRKTSAMKKAKTDISKVSEVNSKSDFTQSKSSCSDRVKGNNSVRSKSLEKGRRKVKSVRLKSSSSDSESILSKHGYEKLETKLSNLSLHQCSTDLKNCAEFFTDNCKAVTNLDLAFMDSEVSIDLEMKHDDSADSREATKSVDLLAVSNKLNGGEPRKSTNRKESLKTKKERPVDRQTFEIDLEETEKNEAIACAETTERSTEISQLLVKNASDVSAIMDAKERVEGMFDVQLIVSRGENDNTVSVKITGTDANCLSCKEYLLALTEPGCRICFDYPPEKHDIVSSTEVHDKLERDSQAVVVFLKVGRLEVRGVDSLSVALALCSLENLLENHSTTGLSDADSRVTKSEASVRRSSILLEKELKSLVTDTDPISKGYETANDAVKFSILSVVKDEGRAERIESLSATNTVPSALNQIFDAYESILDDSSILVSLSDADDDSCILVSLSDADDNHLITDDLTKNTTDLVKNSEHPESNQSHDMKSCKIFCGDITGKSNVDERIDHQGDADSESQVKTAAGGSDATPEEISRLTADKSTGDRANQVKLPDDRSCARDIPRTKSLAPVFEVPKTNNNHEPGKCLLQTFSSTATAHTLNQNRLKQPLLDTRFISNNFLQSHIWKPANQPLLTQNNNIQNINAFVQLASNINKRRYIVIDGSNVAMAHGQHKVFSCLGIAICIQYFLDRGHSKDQITAFVPQSRLSISAYQKIADRHLLTKLADQGLVIFTPARQFPGKRIVCYDDRYVLRLAAHTGGIIVSNDNYRDLWHQNFEWREIIETRLLPFSFVRNLFMPPDDPLGQNGPNLDQFLTHQASFPTSKTQFGVAKDSRY